MSRKKKAAENAPAKVARAVKAAAKPKTTKAQRRAIERLKVQNTMNDVQNTVLDQRADAQRSAALVEELQMTINVLQRETYELLLEQDQWQDYEPPADGPLEVEASAAAMRAANDALRATAAQLEQKISTDAQNFGGAVASLNAEIGRLHAELRSTRERARDELEHAQERAKADLQHLAERARCDQEKLRRLLTSIGSLVEDIAGP